MGRRSRHSAKTGDRSIYRSRATGAGPDDAGSDDDPVHDEVDRYHNRREEAEENYLKLDGDDDGEGDESSEDDGITKRREGVFDRGSSNEEEDDEGDDDDEEDEREARCTTQRRAAALEAAMASSSDNDSDDDGEEDEGGKSSDLLNWGTRSSRTSTGTRPTWRSGRTSRTHISRRRRGGRSDAMDDADFLLGGDGGGEKEEEEVRERKPKKKKKTKEDKVETVRAAVKSSRQLSRKERSKLLKANHPELMPLVQHFAGPMQELRETTLVAAGALLKKGVARGCREAEAVGAIPAGLQYLITKSMLQASTTLNMILDFLLKTEQAANNDVDAGIALMDEDEGDDFAITPLNELSKLTDKLQEGVEDKIPGLKEQMNSLVKAAALMEGGELSSSDSSEDDEDGTSSSEPELASNTETKVAAPSFASDGSAGDRSESSSDSEDERAAQEAAQRRIMTEARFALRDQDVDRDRGKNAKKRKRRLAPAASDYGDETQEVTGNALAAGRKLASTMNSIVQKSTTSSKKKQRPLGDEEAGEDDEYDDIARGVAMMEEEFGKDSDDGGDKSGDEGDAEGLPESDEDDFYQKMKLKSKAKKQAKKQMYAVAPKYPRLEGEVEGERAIGRIIMKNRGLVAHKAKINRNPRVKKREQYRKALHSQKGSCQRCPYGRGSCLWGRGDGY
ncbi:LOW QUALITY PROTEIN: hypothetical protein ACHAWF_018619 [Thalassiosira exigua]